MKRFFAISLLSIYLISLTELSQLIKLPLLVVHFVEHKEKNSDLSLWNFLYMHYAQHNDHDGDTEKDMQLPFKSHNNCVNASTIVFLSNSFQQFLVKPACTETNRYLAHSDNFLPFAYLSSIWQPPKSC